MAPARHYVGNITLRNRIGTDANGGQECCRLVKMFCFSFQPFSVGMLAVEPGHDTSNVNCWMDIRAGKFPQTAPLQGITQIGEPLTILIFLSDAGQNKFDVRAQVRFVFFNPTGTVSCCSGLLGLRLGILQRGRDYPTTADQ